MKALKGAPLEIRRRCRMAMRLQRRLNKGDVVSHVELADLELHLRFLGIAGVEFDLRRARVAAFTGAVAPAKPAKGEPRRRRRSFSDEFYDSAIWRRLRFDVLVKYGRRCMCCGRTPDHGITINVDHIRPIKLFPELRLDPSNLQVLCDACNEGKGNRHICDFRPDRFRTRDVLALEEIMASSLSR